MATEREWIYSATRIPRDGEAVEWKTPDGEIVRGRKGKGRVWHTENRGGRLAGMIVFYVPLYWRPIQPAY